MKRALAILLTLCLIVSLAGCVSQSDLDAVIAEKDALQANYDALQADYAAMQATLDQHADLISVMDAEDYGAAMHIISEKQIAKEVAEKGDIDEYLVTVNLTIDNFNDYFEWKNFYAFNDFGEELEYSYRSVLTSKVYDQGLILYDCDVKLGYTQTVGVNYFGKEDIHSIEDTNVWDENTMPCCGSESAEGVKYDLEKCHTKTTRVEGTVTFVKEEYIADYKLSEMDTNSYQNADITLVNGEHISRNIRFGCNY